MKTSYKMLISDWSSDVFSSDLTLSPSDVLAWFGDRQAITGTGALRHVAALWDSGQQERAREVARQYWVDAAFASRAESARSEERRVGKECVSKCRSWLSPYHSKKTDRTYLTLYVLTNIS